MTQQAQPYTGTEEPTPYIGNEIYLTRSGDVIFKGINEQFYHLTTFIKDKKWRIFFWRGKNYKVHQAVYELFNRKKPAYIGFKDGNTLNVSLNNLVEMRAPNCEKGNTDFWQIRREYLQGEKISDIAERHGITKVRVSTICLGFNNCPEGVVGALVG